MIRYYITDRSRVPDLRTHIARLIERQAMDWIQIREKDLSARELFSLTSDVVALARPAGIRVLVNERADVAMAAGADGVHLPANSALLASPTRKFVGVSCHNEFELRRAEREGASFAVLGPVFSPLSKTYVGPILGLAEFQRLAALVTIPVLALGGISMATAQQCMEAGAAGIAGISLFDLSR